MEQGICVVSLSTKNLSNEKRKKLKKALGLQYKAKRLNKQPKKIRNFELKKTLLKKSNKLISQVHFIPLYN